MAHDSYREFLLALENVGELRRISTPVATELEITEIADREMKKPGGGQALLFEQPTINGEPSPIPLAINTYGSEKRMAMVLGRSSVEDAADELNKLVKAKPPTSLGETFKLLGTALDLRHAKPKKVSNGPCKEVIHKFEIDSPSTLNPQLSTLLNFPIQQCWPEDAGRFLTLPCVVTHDPDTGDRNLGLYRMQVFDGQTTALHWQLQKVAARHGRRYYEKGERMPVSVFLGGDPVYAFCASAPLPDGLDELLLATQAVAVRKDEEESNKNGLANTVTFDVLVSGKTSLEQTEICALMTQHEFDWEIQGD